MKTIVEILIDNSNSMGPFELQEDKKEYLLPDGSTRMSLAKTILVEEILPLIDYAAKVTVRLFHSNTVDKVQIPKIEPIYETHFDLEILSQIIKEIPDPVNTGGTPITAAVQVSIDALAKYSEDDRKIILVTDGQETDGGDYKITAEAALKQYGIPCKIFIIGIAQSDEAEAKSKALAKTTEGSYIGLRAKVYNKENLQSILRPLKKDVIGSSIETTTTIPVKPVPPTAPVAQQSIPSQLITPRQPIIPTVQTTSNPQIVQLTSPSVPTNPVVPTAEAKEELEDESKIIDQGNEVSNDVIVERLEQNTTAIKLISKQLDNLSEELKDLKNNKASENEDEEPIVTENAELNERVRLASESFLFDKLKQKFGERIKWLNEKGESGKSHDFEVLDVLDDTIEYFIECKGSMYSDKIFYLTKHEWHFFLENTKNYQLFFVSNALVSPELTKIDNFKDWLMKGKVVPYASKNIRLKAERIQFAIIE